MIEIAVSAGGVLSITASDPSVTAVTLTPTLLARSSNEMLIDTAPFPLPGASDPFLVRWFGKEAHYWHAAYGRICPPSALECCTRVYRRAVFDAVNEKKVRAFITPKKMGAQTAEANNNAGVAAAKQERARAASSRPHQHTLS